MNEQQPKPTDAELNPELAQVLYSLGTKIAAGAKAQGPQPPEPKPPAKVYQLPFWPDPVRGAPNTLLRSAFFAAIHRKRRELGERVNPDEPKRGILIASQEGIRITYTGDQLNQYDADVFFEALDLARRHPPLGTECCFTGYAFLKAIGCAVGKLNYQDLNNSLTRLRDGRVEIDWKLNGRKFHFEGGLISKYKREENSRFYKVTFAEEICDLFADACWTQLEWDERMALKGKPLAQWLHSFYCTHANPFPLGIAYLHEKSGSHRALLKHFRVDLKNALAILEDTLGWKAGWTGDLLTIERPRTPSQARHLRNAKAPTKRLPPKPKRIGLTRIRDLFSGTN
jgi:hypothetical protein